VTQASGSVSSTLSWNKFHPIFGKTLKVAFETSFPPHSMELDFSEVPEGVDRSQLLFANGFAMKVYHPAFADGDVSEKDQGITMFIPWVDEETAQYHRLVFRRDPKSTARVVFARFGEKEPFMFELGRSYINLDFESKTDSFVPVYARIDMPGKPLVYLVIYAKSVANKEVDREAHLADTVVVLAKRVGEAEVPDHLR